MSEIRPALTPEEWETVQHPSDGKPPVIGVSAKITANSDSIRDHAFVFGDALHAHAALALFGQPFGFTWEDVDLLHAIVSHLEGGGEDEVRDLADRIAALLPPRER